MSRISVVIPALEEAPNLAELLPQLAGQSLPPREVVVADHCSQDGSAQVAARWGARLVPGGRPAQARNAGAAHCSGQWLFFIDADSRLPGPHFLGSALEELERRGLTAAVSDVRPHYRPGDRGHDRPGLRAWDSLLMGAQNRGQRAWLALGFPVGTAQFMAVRRDAFTALGGFSPAAEPFEDSELLLRLHRRLLPPPGERSCVGILDPGLAALVSMRRYDREGRFFYPLRISLRATFLRFLLGRELPLPDYWSGGRSDRGGS